MRQCNWVSGIKGFVPETDEIVTDYLQHVYQIPAQHLAVISGPTHAEEVARERLTFITAASFNPNLADHVRQQIRCRYTNVSVSNDIRGIQYATALKNIYAVAAGIVTGMGYGDNLLAVMVSNAIAEMHNFLTTLLPLMLSLALPALETELIIAGAVMPLVPGLAMTNAVQDTMRGDMVSGISHGVQAILTAFLIAGGALLAVEIMHLMTGGVV